MPNIIILTPGFPKDENDDTCIPYLQDYVWTLANTIGKENVNVITFQYPFTAGEYLWNGIKVYSAGGKNKKGFYKYFTWRRVRQKAAVWIKKEKTILHSFWLNETTYIAQTLAVKFRCKIIATIMGQDVLTENTYLSRINWQTFDVIAPNTKAADAFYKTTLHNVQSVIRPGVRSSDYPPEDKSIDLLYAGAFISLKQPLLFVEIVNQLRAAFPQLQCVMMGDGVLHNAVKALIERYQLSNILLTGKQSRKQVFEYMRRSKILVHTAQYEGHATVFEEAIMHNMQSVCFDVGRPQDGSIHVCENQNAMVEKIAWLLTEGGHHLGLRQHTIARTVEQYLSEYLK